MKKNFFYLALLIATASQAQTDQEIAEKRRAQQEQETRLQDPNMLIAAEGCIQASIDPSGTLMSFVSTDRGMNIDADNCSSVYLKEINRLNTIPMMVSMPTKMASSPNFVSQYSLVYASSEKEPETCARSIEKDGREYWRFHDDLDIYITDMYKDETVQVSNNDYYESEICYSPNGHKIVYTSLEHGDPELFVMDLNTKEKIQITHEVGYEGNASFSPSGEYIVFQAYRPETKAEIEEYEKNLEKGILDASQMEIFICDADGQNLRQLTQLGKRNWTPCFSPSGDFVVFSSNHNSIVDGSGFQLYSLSLQDKSLEQITFSSAYNAYPRFTPDGQYILFSSKRFGDILDPQLGIVLSLWEE